MQLLYTAVLTFKYKSLHLIKSELKNSENKNLYDSKLNLPGGGSGVGE